MTDEAIQVADAAYEFGRVIAKHNLLKLGWKYVRVADIPGATKIMKDFSSITIKKTGKANWNLVKGLEGELDYAIRFKDEIVEARRPVGKYREIDFVLKGNVFAEVKNYNWNSPFYRSERGMKITKARLLAQAKAYL